MFVELLELILEDQASSLIIILSAEIFPVAHFTVVSTVEFEYITERSDTLDVDIIELLNEGESGLEVTFEREHLLLVLKGNHGQFRCEGHILESLLVRDGVVCNRRVKLFQADAWHITNIVTLFGSRAELS